MLNGGCYEVKKHCQRQKYDCPTTFSRNEKNKTLSNQLYGYCKDLVISRHMVRYILTRVISVKSSKNLEKNASDDGKGVRLIGAFNGSWYA